MSYEVTIKRAAEKPSLTQEDFDRIVREDSSLSGGKCEPIIWTDPSGGQSRYINIAPESGELSSDDTRGPEESGLRFLEKLRSIARLLDARLLAEGEDITDAPATRAARVEDGSAAG